MELFSAATRKLFFVVGFDDISTIVGYWTPNHIYTFILSIYGLETYFIDKILGRKSNNLTSIIFLCTFTLKCKTFVDGNFIFKIS